MDACFFGDRYHRRLSVVVPGCDDVALAAYPPIG
jgi:hypothetical protein